MFFSKSVLLSFCVSLLSLNLANARVPKLNERDLSGQDAQIFGRVARLLNVNAKRQATTIHCIQNDVWTAIASNPLRKVACASLMHSPEATVTVTTTPTM
jgi:predicted membrane metal-binding protein